MTFCEAIEAMKQGEEVRRPAWKKLACMFMRHGTIWDRTNNGTEYYVGQFPQAMVLADDWEILEAEEREEPTEEPSPEMVRAFNRWMGISTE